MSGGGQQAFPASWTEHGPPMSGMSYRQWLAGMIAGHMLDSQGLIAELAEAIESEEISGEKTVRIWGKSVWLMVDAVIEGEGGK